MVEEDDSTGSDIPVRSGVASRVAVGLGCIASIALVAIVVWLWIVAPEMRTRAILLFTVALVMQLAGAWLVILDVRQSIRHTRRLRADLATAENTAQEHHRALAEGPEVVRRFRAALGQQQTDQIVRQLGPTSLHQREALVRHLNAQNEISDFRRWGGVAILLAGVIVGFVANVVAVLYA
ncbi:hypothetical protein A5633_17065 [Mycolicibacterium elephantis]|nr:hypothetical protein A5633_17065 [Mycolicibacterium elephantis]